MGQDTLAFYVLPSKMKMIFLHLLVVLMSRTFFTPPMVGPKARAFPAGIFLNSSNSQA
jgi:hypothetical protein